MPWCHLKTTHKSAKFETFFAFFFAPACERIFIKTKNVENRCYRTGTFTVSRRVPESFSPDFFFTGWGSEGVNSIVVQSLCITNSPCLTFRRNGDAWRGRSCHFNLLFHDWRESTTSLRVILIHIIFFDWRECAMSVRVILIRIVSWLAWMYDECPCNFNSCCFLIGVSVLWMSV